jgi:hypothetical protein
MEDTLNGTIGMSLTLAGSPGPVLVEEDNNGTPSSIKNAQMLTPSLPPQKKQTKRPPVNQSIVWGHFKKVEPIDKENPKAMCSHCSRLIGCHHRRNGTSAMMTHLQFNCPNSPLKKSKLSKNQTLLQMSLKKAVDNTRSPQMRFVKFDPDNVRSLLVQYLIKCELPFRHVETEGFKEFVNELEPRFKVPCRATVQRDCMKLYMEEKLKLKTLLSAQRVCLTTDTWTSLQNLNYMCVTAHFIDCDWIMHKKILKFCLVPNHKDDTTGRVLETTLIEWGLDSIFTITVNNASSNDVGIEYMRRKMKDMNSTVLGGEFIHIRCAAHILNLVVNDGLKDLNDVICNVRNAVRYVRSSPTRMAMFKDCIERKNIQCKKMVCLDVSTKWNSTYLMLSIAEKYKRAFELMGEEDEHLVVPGFLDWENVRVFVKFLKIFYDATLNISGSNYVTSNLYFMQLCIIQDTLNDGCLSSDHVMSVMAINMRSKYEKYWGSIDRINLMLYVAFVVDPRYKMKGLVFWLKRCNGSEWADQIEAKVRHLLNRLIEQYSKFYGSVVSRFDVAIGSLNATSSNVVDDDSENAMDKFNSLFSQHLVEENDLDYRSEVDRYLLDRCEATTKEFDVLAWWKINRPKYPILAEIARDVLAIPISTVASESKFSTEERVLDPFRSSLSPLTVEALICTQNWIRKKPIDIRELEEFVESYDE